MTNRPDRTTQPGYPPPPPPLDSNQATRPGTYPTPSQAETRPTTPITLPTPPTYPVGPARQTGRGCGCLGQALLWTGLVLVLLLFAGGVLFLASYYYVASGLPAPEELEQRSFTFASSRIYDRNGGLMWELMDPQAGKRTWVPLSQISPYLQGATIATEDRNFYSNTGVDLIAVARALYYNLTEGKIVSGGSTITQQLARNVLLEPEERNEQTLWRKLREAVLAVELARRYPKDKILEIYLNQIYYGNLAYGIEAASQTYFGKHAAELSLAEAALLAGLPQAPASYDPLVNPMGAKVRQQTVLNLMVEAGYITRDQAAAALAEELHYLQPMMEFPAPHFVVYVRQVLEARYGPDLIYREPGLRVYTTLDPRLQHMAETEIARQVDALRDLEVTNGAAVILNARTGEILAMVGSRDFNDAAISGQVNMAVQPRQPGSAIKPLTYLAAFERGWTPATLLMDVPVAYPDGQGGEYRPTNYDGKFRGPVLLRSALANSLNIPAVKTLEFVSVPGLQEMAQRLGITTLTRNDYGLSLTLGGGEVSLLELTGAFQAMANGGRRQPPTAILRVTDGLERPIEEYRPGEGAPVLRPEHAYLISHILSDNRARTPVFGANSPLKLSRPAAAKTGTTNDFRDNWVIGYTPELVVGVWVGNADNHPMRGVSGVSGAGPIWHNIMENALAGLPVSDFVRPSGIVELEICSESGTRPGPLCPERTFELFAYDQPPLGPEYDIRQRLRIDTRANCVTRLPGPAEFIQEREFHVYPPDGREWALQHGFEQPPPPCPESPGLSSAQAAITWPSEGQSVQGVVLVQGVALAAGFAYYQLEYGVGPSPQVFGPLAGPFNQPVEYGLLAEWDTRPLPNGLYTLRLLVFDEANMAHEARTIVLVDNPLAPPAMPATSVLPYVTPTPVFEEPVIPEFPAADITPTPLWPEEPPVQEPWPPLPGDTPPPLPPIDTPLPLPPPPPIDTPVPLPPPDTPPPAPDETATPVAPTETATPSPADTLPPEPPPADTLPPAPPGSEVPIPPDTPVPLSGEVPTPP